MAEIRKKKEIIFFLILLIFIVIILLINSVLYSFFYNYTSFFRAVISVLNLISYVVFGYVIYLIQKHILEPQKSIEKTKSMGIKLIFFSLFIIYSNTLYLIYGLDKTLPGSGSVFMVLYTILSIPFYFNTITFNIYGFYLTLKTRRKRDFSTLRKPEYILINRPEKIRKIKRIEFSKKLKIEALLTMIFSLSMLGYSTSFHRIGYTINYDVNTNDPDTIINLVETLDYQSLIQYHEGVEVYNITDNPLLNLHYFDREYIEYLKGLLNNDSKESHWFPGHYYFHYLLKATEEPKIYFTYYNNTIIKAQYESYEDIFVSRGSVNCYINHSLIPNAVYETSISLNNTFFVEMKLEYDHLYGSLGGTFFEVTQILVLDADYNVLFIYMPRPQIICA